MMTLVAILINENVAYQDSFENDDGLDSFEDSFGDVAELAVRLWKVTPVLLSQ